MPITRAYGQASQLGNTPAASNPIINGGMDIWQRGTTFTNCSSVYVADRWYSFTNGVTTGRTITRQTTGDTTNLPNIQYCIRVGRDSGNTNTLGITLSQPMETVDSIAFAGKTVTFSFYARRGANYSAASNSLGVYLVTGTGTDQNQQASGYTGTALPVNSTATLTTTWQRFTFTATIAQTATEICPVFVHIPVGTAGAADYFEITGVQIDIGSVALPFRRAMNTLAGEFQACQRYYQILGDTIYEIMDGGYMTNGTIAYASWTYPVPMRTAPTGTLVGGWAVFNTGQPVIQAAQQRTITLRATCIATGQFYYHSNTTYYLTMSAEL